MLVTVLPHLQGAGSAYRAKNITTIVVDEVHTRSVQSDYTFVLTLFAMQLSDKIRLVMMRATGDHDLLNN